MKLLEAIRSSVGGEPWKPRNIAYAIIGTLRVKHGWDDSRMVVDLIEVLAKMPGENLAMAYNDLNPDSEDGPFLIEGSGSKESFLSAKERSKISRALHQNAVFSGIKKIAEVRDAISPLAESLRSVGFTLDMVPGDILMGDSGSRQLSFRRTHPDPMEELPMIENSRISFTWETLSPDNVEVIAYVS